MNQTNDTQLIESVSNLSLNERIKPKRGRPPKPDAKDENGKYISKIKWNKKDYEENSTKLYEKINERRLKYKDGYNALKELVTTYNIEIPEQMKEKINKLMCH
jgi:hypothetical protein